ncbi:MAG: CxxxxCH/CxxCH domain-containing protein [Nitrospiraceae bacterium]|nr:MAG: CxxxxCH/CxxCH domain-containing protein [Nitrospiraceae bacterium]
MSRLKDLIKTVLIAACLISAAGCGSKNGASLVDPETGEHSENWIAGHNTSHDGSNTCESCHGEDLSGGIAPSCTTTCHMENADSVHPASWTGTAILREHGGYVNANGTDKCANQYCHGASLAGVAGSGPSCTLCHALPFTGINCTGCHGYPPSGAQHPDTAGKHAEHTALANVDCDTCHAGAGNGTTNHYNGAVEVALNAAFNSKSGEASFDAGSRTCSNISCHGGPRTQTQDQGNRSAPVSTSAQTPDWLNSVIDVDSQCTLCHVYGTDAADPEYNSYYSGQHRFHVYVQDISCTNCHDTGNLANHFTNLDTPELSNPIATIRTDVFYLSGDCTNLCHGLKTW